MLCPGGWEVREKALLAGSLELSPPRFGHRVGVRWAGEEPVGRPWALKGVMLGLRQRHGWKRAVRDLLLPPKGWTLEGQVAGEGTF